MSTASSFSGFGTFGSDDFGPGHADGIVAQNELVYIWTLSFAF